MARAYYVNGQCLVKVRGMIGSGLDSANNNNAYYELGLTDGRGRVTITPNYKHKDYKYDDWGDMEVPPEVMWMLTDVTITMTLVHFDYTVLSACISESAGGGTEGKMKGTGTPIGAGKEMYESGNHYMSLYLSSPNANAWRFQTCYLNSTPINWQVSAERSLVQCIWRSIPYSPLTPGIEMRSENIVVWDHAGSEMEDF